MKPVLHPEKKEEGTNLIQRSVSRPIPLDPPSLAQRKLESLSQSERTILSGVVVVDLEIPFTVESEGHAAVLGQSMQHLVFKWR